MEISKESIMLFAELRKAVQDGDTDKAHRMHDRVLLELAKQYEPRTVELLDEITGDMEFGYHTVLQELE